MSLFDTLMNYQKQLNDVRAQLNNIARLDRAARNSNTNIIINGGFTINQRSYVSGATLASAVYGHDRWKAGANGGNYSFTQLASPTTITIAANKTLIQVIEDKNVIGGTYTLSWTGTAEGRYAVDSDTPAGAYAASPITITGQTPGTTMSVEFNAGTLCNVQLEPGSVVTPFEFRLYEQELELCKRYYERFTKTGAGGFTPPQSLAHIDTANRGECYLHWAEKRAIPTASLRTYSNWAWVNIIAGGGKSLTQNIAFLTGAHRTGGNAFAYCAATLSAGSVVYLGTSTAGEYLEVTAEL